jgi:glycosyl transferase family 87
MDFRFALRDSGARTQSLLNTLVTALWVTALVIVCFRVALSYPQHDVFVTYVDAGRKWIESQPLYSTTRGFVYSPLIAACFAPFSWLPERLGAVLWRLLNAAAFCWAVAWWLKMGLHDRIPKTGSWLVFLLLLPLAIGNFNNGQVNPLIIGLLMISILAAYSGQWTTAALCIGISAYIKIYPLAVGLLLVLLYPRQLGWRLAAVLVLLGALSFVFQRPGYVFEQYQRWFVSRGADNRRMNMDIAPRDFAMLLRIVHINLSGHAIIAMQVLAGAAAAAVCIFGRIERWSEKRLLTCVFALGSCWMLLFGPSTEAATYVMLAPPLVLAMVDAFYQPRSSAMRILVCISFAVLLLGLGMSSFLSLKKGVYNMSVQPLGAVIFAVYAVTWTLMSSPWDQRAPGKWKVPRVDSEGAPGT